MNHISVLEIYLELVYRKLLCTELSDVIYYTYIIFKKCKNCYRKIWLNESDFLSDYFTSFTKFTNSHIIYIIFKRKFSLLIKLVSLAEYSDVNPHSVTPRHLQCEFKINVWIGVIDRYLIAPVILPNRLNSETYLKFLQNTFPDLLDEVPLQLRLEHWFMHDGAPPHFSIMVRDFLNHQYPNKWIVRGNNCLQVWPPRSLDLNKCDFFFLRDVKRICVCLDSCVPSRIVESHYR
ncbi:hypothetical protein NQ318_009944 [Aromia moschata]|uniref:Transposase n=1 Tax=Aromia moschata TaxID=1265417 RepID=A0AAV8XVV9_9CUCU|nr:hypothetical protein NQ318_009944 [Aromia moschata]